MAPVLACMNQPLNHFTVVMIMHKFVVSMLMNV